MLFKREIFITRDLKLMNRIRDTLGAKGIRTTVKIGSTFNQGRYHGTPGIDSKSSYEYRIFVKRKDYEKAVFFLK